MGAVRWMPLGLVLGCSTKVDLADQGAACVLPNGAGTYYDWYENGISMSEGASEIEVTLDDCYSSSVTDTHASSEATVDGTVISVVSEGGYTETSGDQNSDCNRLAARCPGPELTAGTWTLEYGGTSVTFDVPGDGPACAEAQ
ncbi:MAG: hypothetical protein KC621_23005 [Myxococcales bacterium]|nr:hypothetical protein [Myxococcales bacterium]